MKRHEQLQPLSRQHHNGLLASLLLKKGIARNANAQTMADFIKDFWKNDLEEHFRNEEKILLPALDDTGLNKSLTEKLLEEHNVLRSLINNISSKGINLPESIQQFSTLLESHIRFEERIYFPEAEKHLDETVLNKIGEALNDDDKEKNCINYPIQFWE